MFQLGTIPTSVYVRGYSFNWNINQSSSSSLLLGFSNYPHVCPFSSFFSFPKSQSKISCKPNWIPIWHKTPHRQWGHQKQQKHCFWFLLSKTKVWNWCCNAPWRSLKKNKNYTKNHLKSILIKTRQFRFLTIFGCEIRSNILRQTLCLPLAKKRFVSKKLFYFVVN